MRQLVRRARARIQKLVDESAWIPLAGKALGIAASLLLLAAIGAGHLDRTFDLGPSRALAAAPARAHRAAATSSTSAVTSGAAAASISPSASASAKAGAAVRRIVLNEATAADLESLPGVGPAKAQAILALREKLGGRFKRFEDLLRVRGIKRRALLKIREHAVLDAPPPDEPQAPPSPSGSAAPKPAPAAAPRSW